MNGKELLKQYKVVLDKELEKYLDQKIEEAAKISPLTKELMEHVKDLTLRGGKRIRAALLYYSYLAHGGKNKKEALKASMSMELSETYLLIHDDIMDCDHLRRGGDTIHESYRHIADERYNNKTNSKHLGESLAILAGDVSCSLSNELLSSGKFKPQYINRALLELNKIYVTECYGQALDVLFQLQDNVQKDDVILVHQLKTVPYTFDGPAKIGAILAGASEADLKKMEDYTVPLGTAFQIQDDILGLFGAVENTGKPVLSDLMEGKKTLLIITALDKASPDQRDIITSNLGNKKVTMAGLKQVRKVVEDTWSLAESKRMASNLVQDSISSMEKLKLRPEGKDFLLAIADYIIHREY